MSEISDAAAITWVVKSNMASSACMSNQMKMYRKGVLDGSDGKIDEDWSSDNKNISFDINGFDNNGDLPGNAIAPAAIDLTKGLTWRFLANGSDPNDPANYVYAKVWIEQNWSFDDDWYWGIEYGRVLGDVFNAYGGRDTRWGYDSGGPVSFSYRRSYSALPKGIYAKNGDGHIENYIPNKMIRLNSTSWYHSSTADALFIWGTYRVGIGGAYERIVEANDYYSYPGTGLTLYVPNSSQYTFIDCTSNAPDWLPK